MTKHYRPINSMSPAERGAAWDAGMRATMERARKQMAQYIEIPVATKVVATVAHNGRQYRPTWKYGYRFTDNALVFEFSCREPGIEFRLWAKADGSEVEED